MLLPLSFFGAAVALLCTMVFFFILLVRKASFLETKVQKILEESAEINLRAIDSELSRMRSSLEGVLRESHLGMTKALNESSLSLTAHIQSTLLEARNSQDETLSRMQNSLYRGFTEVTASQTQSSEILQTKVQTKLDEIRTNNEKKLEQMRETVEQKLQVTLENRLNTSFNAVSLQLEQVHRGLGEMQQLAKGVGDLKSVLSNVRVRGTLGEMQLEILLEEVLTPDQYAKNVATNPTSTDRVEFAIKMPGGDDAHPVYLPIDSKFPQEDYLRLLHAHELGDADKFDQARKSLSARILDEANKIRKKYVSPPHTTEFAILFVATEGLYAEILRIPSLWDQLQNLKIIPAGPTTLFAILNSLQMGFRTLAIQKRSSEVWRVLGGVKTEFEKFGASLQAVNKKLQEASSKMDETTKRTRILTQRLNSVESLPEAEMEQLLNLPLPPGESELFADA